MVSPRRALLALSALLFMVATASAWQASRQLWPRVPLVTAAHPVASGTRLAAGDLAIRMVAAGDRLPGALTDLRTAIGRYAVHAIFPGEQILGPMVGPAPSHRGGLVLSLSGSQVIRPRSMPAGSLVTILGVPPGGTPTLIGVHVPAYPTADGVRLEVTPTLALRAVDALRNGPLYLLQETS